MATEKSWYMSGNVNLNGSSATEVAQNFMFELYNTLSGGNGNDEAKWEIRSASAGVGAVVSYGPALQPSDFVFATAGSNHSYFLARKSTLLPQTGSGGRYIYFYADCEDTTGNKAYFAFDHQPPSSNGTATNRPAETAYAFEKDGQSFFTGYDGSYPTYYHSCIDTTGSFHIITSRGNTSNNPYQFAMSCARIETPRTGSVDPFPVFLKCGHATAWVATQWSIGGPWSGKGCSDGATTDWADTVGYAQGSWRVDSTVNTADECLLMFPGTIDPAQQYNPWVEFGPAASPIDGTWPLTPTFVFTANNVANPMGVRGRLPDVHIANFQYYIDGAYSNTANLNWLAGATIPQTGTPTHCAAGAWWLPFTASLLPGL
tara:strand:+ start:437 stop:1555 length:1119 start_codon:yes stop_codon:yes gene_type:complete